MVKTSNFDTRPYRLLNLLDAPDFPTFMAVVEMDTLKKLFGITLYDALIAGLAEDPIPDKWTKLKDGDTYEYKNVMYEYRGLVDLLVPRIYSAWLSENRDKWTTSGAVINIDKQSDHLSPAGRIVRDYNMFCHKVGGPNEQKNTLYGFMVNSEFDYGTFPFIQPCTINEFGL